MEPGSLVIGIGNPLLGADAFGPAVVERLRTRPDLPGRTTLHDAHTDLLGCLELFAEYACVIVVDAVVGGAGTGEVVVFDEETFGRWDPTSPDSHAMSALLAIGLFRRLFPGAGTTFAVVGLDAPGAAISEPVRAAQVDAGASAVIRLLTPPP